MYFKDKVPESEIEDTEVEVDSESRASEERVLGHECCKAFDCCFFRRPWVMGRTKGADISLLNRRVESAVRLVTL